MHRFAVLTACATFVLVCAGGLVTSTGSGLAVPDWPLSYGMVFPPMIGGILYEHGHRLIAATVATMTTILAVWVWWKEPRRAVRRLAAAALAAVLCQALLGGLTVIFLLPMAVSVSHAGLAMIFFSLTTALALVTSPAWGARRDVAPEHEAVMMGTRRLLVATTAAIYGQILLGAWMRHSDAGLAIPTFPLAFGHLIPPAFTRPIAIHFAHRVGAVAVFAMVVWAATRIMRRHRAFPQLRRPAVLLKVLLLVQIALGAWTIWSAKAVAVTTAHVAIGALMLVTSVVMTLRAYALRPWHAAEPVVTAAVPERAAGNRPREVTT